MASSNHPQEKGLSGLTLLGMGCSAVSVLGIIFIAILYVLFGTQVEKFVGDAAKNPTRTKANLMVISGLGMREMVAEDDVNKRYTVRDKRNGNLTTIYWNAQNQRIELIPGDFSAIPPEASAPSGPAPH